MARVRLIATRLEALFRAAPRYPLHMWGPVWALLRDPGWSGWAGRGLLSAGVVGSHRLTAMDDETGQPGNPQSPLFPGPAVADIFAATDDKAEAARGRPVRGELSVF